MTPTIKDQGDERSTVDKTPTVGGVLLAAGESERFGHGNKLISTIDGMPIVRQAAKSLVDSHLDEVVVVVGHESAVVQDALSSLDVSFRSNQHYEEGQSTSVGLGVEVAREKDWDAALFALGDMPFVKSETVDIVLSSYLCGHGTIITAAFQGKRGNPVLFDADHFDRLAAVTGDKGGRRLIEECEESILVETNDPGVTRDIDYQADLEKYTE